MINIDNIIIGVFLLLVIWFGLASSRKIKSIRDYAIANKTYSTIPILLTMIATMIGGDDTTGDVGEFFSNGIIYALPYIGFIISLIVIAKYIAPKFNKRFHGMLSVADMMHSFYGERVAITSGVIATIVTLGNASVQSVALGRIVSACINLGYTSSVLIASGIVVLYTMVGGIRSVVITDIFQFSVLVVMVPVISSIPVAHIGGVFKLIQKIPQTHLNIFDNKNFYEYVALFFIWAMPINVLFPPMVQRFLMCKDTNQISRIMYIYAAVLFLLLLITISLSFSTLVLYPNINAKEIVPHIINNLLPSGIRGLAIAGIMAAIMSTLDSNLNSASILFTHNVLARGKLESLRMIKFNTLILGAVQMMVALLDLDIVNVVVFTQSILAVGIGIPLFFGISGIKAKPTDFWMCVIFAALGFLVSIIYFGEINYISSFATILFGGISFLASVYLNSNKSKPLKKQRAIIMKNMFTSITDTIVRTIKMTPRKFDFIKYSNESIKQYGANYVMFAVFSCINYIVPYFMWPHNISQNYAFLLTLRIIAGALCIGLLLKEYWHKYFEQYFGLYWFVTLLYTLVLIPTVMFVLNSGVFEWLLNLTLAVLILALLVEWQVFIFLLILGIALSYLVCSLVEQNLVMIFPLEHLDLGVYFFIFAVLIGLTFSRKRDVAVQSRMSFLKLCGGFIAHELKAPLAHLAISTRIMEKIHEHSSVRSDDDNYYITYRKSDFDLLNKKLSDYKAQITGGSSVIDNLLSSIREGVISKNKTDCNVGSILKRVVCEIPLDKAHKDKIILKIKSPLICIANEKYLEHVFINIILNAHQHAMVKNEGAKLYITLNESTVIFKDTGQGIPQETLKKIFEPYFSLYETGAGLGLYFCKLIVEDIGGSIACESTLGKYTKFIVKLR